MTDPPTSSVSSSDVDTVTVTLPVVGTVTVREPVETPKSPVWATVTLTDNGADGAGLAATVKLAFAPSVTPAPAATLTSGVTGGGSSSSATFTDADPAIPDTV